MKQLTIEDHDAVRICTINNPPRGYMNVETAVELLAVLDAAESDDAVRALIFTGGVPGVFIRHYDVGEIIELASALRSGAIASSGERNASPVYALFDKMIATTVPTIAAINGKCMGGGCEFALACDIRVAEQGEYEIGLPETRLGIIPGVGGLQLLARAVGLPRAREMVMRGRVTGPSEAFSIGLLHELTDGAAVETAMNIAQDIAARPAGAVASVKRMAGAIEDGETLAQGLETAAAEFTQCLLDGDEAIQKMQAFMENGENITLE